MKDTGTLYVRAADIMQRKLITIQAHDTLADAERVLTEAGISGAPVVDNADRLLGVISLKDLTRRHTEDRELPEGTDRAVFDSNLGDDEAVEFERPATGACAADMMTTEVVSVPPTMSAAQIAQHMLDNRVHRVMVMDNRRIVGLVSTTELLGVLAQSS